MRGAPRATATHVLLVEDHELLRRGIEQTLEAKGFKVSVAATGDEAAALLAGALRPDVLLSDVRMPGRLNGLELARWLRQRDPEIAILLMTGFADVHTTDEFRVLAKPFDPGTLVSAIADVLSALRSG